MRIAVLVKEVPDTYADRKLNLSTGLAVRTSGDVVLDEIAERSIEAALAYSDAHDDVEVVLVSMAPSSAAASIRKGLAMGAHRAVQVVDDSLRGADLVLTATVLAAALRRLECDLVIAGNLSTDGSGGVVPAMIAELLDHPQLTQLTRLEIQNNEVAGTRSFDGGTIQVSAALPAVVSVSERFPDGRFPNFKGITAAKKKPFQTLTLEDLGISVAVEERPSSIMTTVAERPPRAAGVTIVDEGNGGEKLADFLVSRRLV